MRSTPLHDSIYVYEYEYEHIRHEQIWHAVELADQPLKYVTNAPSKWGDAFTPPTDCYIGYKV